MRRLSFCIMVTAVIVLDVDSALSQEDTKPVADQKAAVIKDFQLNGEQWTCTADGRPFRGVLLKPEGNSPFPAIIMSHGLGGNAQGIALSRGREFVKWGFVCIATDYTHAGPVGSRGGGDQRSGKGIGPGGARRNLVGVDFSQAGARSENIRRALACLEILRQQSYVDSHRIAAYGHSMGAFVTIALAAATSDKIAAAAITSGGVITADYRAGSAPTAEVAAQVRVPLLILQGSLDTTVPPGSSETFKQVLDKNGVPNSRHVFEGVGHNVPTDRATEVHRLMQEWFEKHGVLLPGKIKNLQR